MLYIKYYIYHIFSYMKYILNIHPLLYMSPNDGVKHSPQSSFFTLNIHKLIPNQKNQPWTTPVTTGWIWGCKKQGQAQPGHTRDHRLDMLYLVHTVYVKQNIHIHTHICNICFFTTHATCIICMIHYIHNFHILFILWKIYAIY